MKPSSTLSTLSAAAFLMATSAIGPGFLTQTSVFTQELGANFGFVILVSIGLDIVAQLNIWQIVGVRGIPAQDLANKTLQGSGYFLSLLIVLGGLAFNIGNVAGAGLGIEVLTGWDIRYGAVLSAGIAIFIFWSAEAGKIMDSFVKYLGVAMILLILYVVFNSKPPLGTALYRSILPERIDFRAIITLVGGTVGGYITFAGIHRLLDAGISGQDALPAIRVSAVRGILLTATVRILLFLAALGVVSAGYTLDSANPAASVFSLASGEVGKKIFGVVMWCAAITSVVGAAYTSVSFLRSFHASIQQYHRFITIGFIVFSTLIFLLVGKPVEVLVFVGLLNGFILPISLAIMLFAASKYRNHPHPFWLSALGWLVVGLLGYMIFSTN